MDLVLFLGGRSKSYRSEYMQAQSGGGMGTSFGGGGGYGSGFSAQRVSGGIMGG